MHISLVYAHKCSYLCIFSFFWVAASSVFATEAADDGDNRWWDIDLTKEEEAALKIVLCLLVLVIACGTLAKTLLKVWHPSKGSFGRFELGVLAASLFMFANMCFISFWYTINYRQDEDDENNRRLKNDDKNDYDDQYYYNQQQQQQQNQQMNDEELLIYHQKVVCTTSFFLGLILSLLSVLIYAEGKKLPDTRCTDTDKEAQIKSVARMELILDLWKLLSISTLTIFSALCVTAWVVSVGGEAERIREEGEVFNLVSVLMWMLCLTVGIMLMGKKILKQKLDGVLGVGMLSGGSMYYALMLFMVFILYANAAFRDDRKDEGMGPAQATSFSSLGLALVYLAFSLMTYKYQSSIMIAIFYDGDDQVGVSDSVESLSQDEVGEFRRMQDDEYEMATTRNENAPGEFKLMEEEKGSDSDFEYVDEDQAVV